MPRNPLGIARSSRRVLCAALALGSFASAASSAEYTLERAVLVSRHGVRAPTDSNMLGYYSLTHKWPKWPVLDACLTPRGKMLASRMGEFYRGHYTVLGLLPQRLNASDVFVLPDVDQRTRQTGLGLLDGIFARKPDNSNFCLKQKDAVDPLFHPVRAGVCQFDKTLAYDAVMQQAGGNLDKALDPYRGTVPQLQSVLDCCKPKPKPKPLCDGIVGACTLETIPSKLDPTPSDVSLSGPIAIGSTVSEVVLLEYAENMPAWGKASTPRPINEFLKLHNLQFNLLQRTKYLAGQQGSALLQQVVETLRQTADRQFAGTRPVPAQAKLVIYVGHDTNLANLGGMLGVTWDFESGMGDKTPPAGAMAFELLREKGAPNNYLIRMTYYSQTLDQMREATRLTGDTKPEIVPITLPAGDSGLCSKTQDGACSWREFYERVSKKVLVDECLPKARGAP